MLWYALCMAIFVAIIAWAARVDSCQDPEETIFDPREESK